MARDILRDGVVEPDALAHIEDDAALPEGPASVSRARFAQERDVLRGRPHLALRIDNTLDVADLDADELALSELVLDLPLFTDGRAYTQARVLRDRLGYAGRIRVRGDVLVDQVEFLRRCGIDVFEPTTGASATALVAGWKTFAEAYQPDAIETQSLWSRRRERARRRAPDGEAARQP